MTPDKSRGLLDRVGDAVLEPVEDHGPIWLQTLCGIAIMLIVVAYHIATWRL